MKKTILIFLIGLGSYAQNLNDKIFDDNPVITCKISKEYHDDNIIVFEENVSFNSNIINLENADKLIYDKNTNEITVYGLKKFDIDGVIQIENGKNINSKKRGILKYTIGERIAYLR